ncbi:MAG: GNAT family N-acetyltransferase [Marinibacterium sp.]
MSLDRLIAAVDGTWPAARHVTCGPWTLREGQGGGQRVSAATANAAAGSGDIPMAEAAMAQLGQKPLFMLRPGEEALDSALAERGYVLHDPVVIHACPPGQLTDRPVPPVTVFTVWEPLYLMREIWAAGGIGPGRLAVMHRAHGPKTGLFARIGDKPAGAGFVALHDGVAMVHALEVLPHQRRKGAAQWMMRAAAIWAAEQGATTLAVLSTAANDPANALYAALAMGRVGGYHYRKQPEPASG